MTTADLTQESTSRSLTLNGLNVHYNDAGSGPAVVMLHGGGPGASGWSNFVRNTEALSRNHRLLLIDMPGYGETDYISNKEPFTEQAARVVKDVLDHLGIDKCSLVGNSLGAAAAVNFSIDYPERTEKLVLLGGSSVGGESLFVPNPTEGTRLLNETFENLSMESMRRLIKSLVYDDSFATDEVLKVRLEAAQKAKRPPEARSAPRRRLDRELDKVGASKTLVIWGANDLHAPLDYALKFLWNIPNAQVHIFSKCGHWAQFEYADDFNNIVGYFLDS